MSWEVDESELIYIDEGIWHGPLGFYFSDEAEQFVPYPYESYSDARTASIGYGIHIHTDPEVYAAC